MKAQSIAVYIDPPSHHFLDDRLFDVNSARLGGDQLMAPYAYMRNVLNARGVDVRTADHLPEKVNGTTTIYVSLGSLSNYRKLAKTRPDVIRSAYFALECPIVEPKMYRALRDARHYFKRIYSWSDSASLERFVGEQVPFESFCWMQSFDDIHEDIWRNTERKFLVMINANKLPRLYWQELYTERMRAVEFFSRTDDIDLYGKGWNAPSIRVGRTWVPYTLKSIRHKLQKNWHLIRPNPLLKAAQRAYRGIADSKAETLGRYKFALCFENSILKGWITEKIFDCFFTGTVPIYWGAPDIEDHVPADCFIDMRRFSGYEELSEFLRSLSEDEIETYKSNARAFLKSPKFYPFSKAAFAELFVRIIEEDAEVSL